jgi:hypothetical protein
MVQQVAPVQPTLVVIEGSRAGQRVPVPNGQATVGRDPGCGIVFEDAGVSRRHAALATSQGVTTILDLGSTNGTWVNGARIAAPRALEPGDRVRLGSVSVMFDRTDAAAPAPSGPAGTFVPVPAPAPPPAPAPASAPAPAPATATATVPGPRGKVSLWRIVLVGGLANLVTVAAGVAIQFLTDWTGIGVWLAAPLVGMVAALVNAGKQAATREPQPAAPAPAPGATVGPGAATAPTAPPYAAPPSAPAPYGTTAPASRPKRRAPLIVGILVAIFVIGLGGAAIAYGVATVTSFITGDQVGTERLANGPVVVDSGGIVTTVESVEHTRDFTRVEIVVQNNLGNTITLPLYGNATFSAEDGSATLDADPFRSSWGDTIAPGQQRHGTLVFGGHLGDAGTTASLAFATVFEQGFEGPDSIVVGGLAIAPFEG